MARPLACTSQLWGGIHPALWNHVPESKGAVFIERTINVPPWAVQQGGTETPSDLKAAVGKGTLAFPGLQNFRLLYHPADEFREVKNFIIYCVRERGGESGLAH